MANVAKQAILRAKLAGVLTDLLPKTITDNVYVDDTTTLTVYLATLATKAELTDLQNAVDALGALASKDKVTIDDLSTALQTLINGKADASALTALTTRVTTAEGKITTLVGSDTGKSVRTIAAEELAAKLIPEDAAAAMDTLAEIAAWIQEHPNDASALNQAVAVIKTKLASFGDNQDVKKYVDDLVAALNIGDYAKASDLATFERDLAFVLQEVGDGLGALAHKDTISVDDLDAALAEIINAASESNHGHSNKTVLDGITATKVSNWDSAYSNRHTHSNKTILDGISAANVAAWDGKANFYASATEPSGLVEGDIWAQIIE